MSDVQETTPVHVAETPVVAETVAAEPTTQEAVSTETPVAVPAVAAAEPVSEEKKDEIAPVEDKKEEEAVAEKTVEPITEGQLGYKAPGFLKSLVSSKKEFWVGEDAVASSDLSSYMRGEKPEVANPVVAWASQTGKGLLFFNKKGETNKKNPASVLALYDATELRKQNPHEISFKLHGNEHTLKAATDAERDGWYLSLEKSAELGKASKESVQESEGYKAELEKLNKPVVAAGPVAAAKRTQSQPKKSIDADKAETADRKNSDVAEEDKKQKKSRSTSRGLVNRLKGKKEELEQKKEEKKEEKAEESKDDDKVAEEAAVPVAGAAVVAGGVVAAEESKETPEEAAPVTETKAEEKPKASKRNSIFGKMAGLGKSKETKEAEPKAESKEAPVSENPPQLPEATAETTEAAVVAVPADAEAQPAAETSEEVAPKEEVASPGKEKKKFLSGLSFAKRGRSVSPSQNVKAESKEETAEAEKPEEPAPVVVAPIVATDVVEKPEEKTEEVTPTANKRQSVFGNIGRRASHYMKGLQHPKKDSAAAKPAEETKDEAATEETKPAEEETAAVEEAKPVEEVQQQQQIGDVVPEAVNVGQPQQTPAVTASA